MSTRDRLSVPALGLATMSLLVAAYAVASRPSASEATECSCDTEALQTEIAALERRVDAAERTAMRGTVRRVADAALEPDRSGAPTTDTLAGANTNAEPVAEPEEPRATPSYESFEVAEPGVSVSQSEDGAISVTNRDPALTGRVVIVKARGEDGERHDLPITVPAPAP